jgi:hypothetical protein
MEDRLDVPERGNRDISWDWGNWGASDLDDRGFGTFTSRIEMAV